MTLRRSTAFIRRGLASELTDRPPKSNEIVHATDTGKVVIGDGVTSFADLTAVGGGGLDESAVQAIVDAAVADLVNGAPGALNTLKELADALGDDASFAAAVTASLAAKVDTAGAGLTKSGTTLALAAGRGVPVGGATAAALVKGSATDYDTAWADLSALYATINDPNAYGYVTNQPTSVAGLTAPAAGANTVVNYTSYTRCTGAGYPITGLMARVTASSGNVCGSVHGSTGTGAARLPNARRATTGSIPCPSSGIATMSLSDGPVTPVITDYLAMGTDNTTATMQVIGSFQVSEPIAAYAGRMTLENTFPAPLNATPLATTPASGSFRFFALRGA